MTKTLNSIKNSFRNGCRASIINCKTYVSASVSYIQQCSVSLRYLEESINNLGTLRDKITSALNFIQVRLVRRIF